MDGNAYILDRIQRSLGQLSRSETRVAQWVLANPGAAAAAAITEVALAVGVSEPTVVRFCRSVGTSGFREFKTRLIAAMHRPESLLHDEVAASDSTAVAVTKVLESAISALVDLREPISAMPFPAAVQVMATARQIVFVGTGASGIVAQDACHKFFRLGLPCSTGLDAQTILQRAAIAGPADVFVAVSNTGAWPALVRAMAVAAGTGATVLAVTDPRSALADVANLVFECHAPAETKMVTPMRSRLVQLVLLDALQVALALHLGPVAHEQMLKAKLVLQQYPDDLLSNNLLPKLGETS